MELSSQIKPISYLKVRVAVCPNSRIGVPILKNCWRSGFVNTARFSSNPTASFTES